MAAVGGVLLLWVRDMPLSISAGVGFIALFGVSVLNGIILIEHFKELKEKGMKDIHELIVQGLKTDYGCTAYCYINCFRLLPMAVSVGVGAEVQRPLSTVVIGGMFTAFILTLVVLPVLYSIFVGTKRKTKSENRKSNSSYLSFSPYRILGNGTKTPSTLEQLQQLAIENNLD